MPRPSRLPALCFLGLLALPRAHAAAPAALPWNADRQGDFILSALTDRQGDLWIGTEGAGLWRCRSTPCRWTHFTAQNGLGDDDIYALAADKMGRVWAGTDRHGVSVWNGKTWKTYDQLTGPLGAHTTALAVCPTDGDVWMGTEAGVAVYSVSKNTWNYDTRAEGLPSDQVKTLAFDPAGNVYVGTACDGLAIASAAGGYKTWRRVTGPNVLPNTPSGKGLPSNLINALLVAKDGTVYVGTDCGLARSADGGQSWTYTRGADFEAKNKGLSRPQPTVPAAVAGDLLTEDYVTSLAQDAAGRLWVGHRQTGVEALDPKTGKRVYASGQEAASDASAVIPGGTG